MNECDVKWWAFVRSCLLDAKWALIWIHLLGIVYGILWGNMGQLYDGYVLICMICNAYYVSKSFTSLGPRDIPAGTQRSIEFAKANHKGIVVTWILLQKAESCLAKGKHGLVREKGPSCIKQRERYGDSKDFLLQKIDESYKKAREGITFSHAKGMRKLNAKRSRRKGEGE